MDRLKPGAKLQRNSNLAGVTAITDSPNARPGFKDGVWEWDHVDGWRGRVSGNRYTFDDLFSHSPNLWVLEVEAEDVLKLPDVPEGTVALIGALTGRRYSKYLETSSWQTDEGEIFTLGELLDTEGGVTPEVSPFTRDIRVLRAWIGDAHGVREALDRIVAALPGGAV